MTTSVQFKKVFSQVAAEHEFQPAFGGWFLSTSLGLVVLALQKSNYGNYFDLLIKAYLDGLFSEKYRPDKKLVSTAVGDIFLASPNTFAGILNLELERNDAALKAELEKLFAEFVDPLALGLSTMDGIQRLFSEKRIHLLPVVREFVQNRSK